jgi:hypothetical protein
MALSVAVAALSALAALRSAGDDVDAVAQACAVLAAALRPHAAKLVAASCSDTLPMLAAALRLAVRCAHPAAAAAAASALRNAAICPEAQASPAAGEAVDAAAATLRCFCSDAAAASAACGALAALAAHAGNARRCAGLEDTGREDTGEGDARRDQDAVAALLAAVARHDADADVAEMGLWCLHNVCRAGPAAAACVAAAGGADVARAAMQRFSRHAAPSACRSGVIQPSGDAREAREAQSGCHGVVGTALTCVPAVAAAVQAAAQARAVLRALGAHDV